jgi:aspartokinase
MDRELIKISDSMQKIQELVDSEIKKPEDMMLVCSALMAVTRNMYVAALGPDDTARMFKEVSNSFHAMEDLLNRFKFAEKPTIH